MSVIEAAVVISRADRPERLAAFRARWDQTFMAHVLVEEFIAPVVTDGAAGCLASHLAVLSAYDQPTLVMEDDACFTDAFPYHAPPPRDWDVLWLGGQHMSPPRPLATGYGAYATAWVRPTELARTHAYIARNPRLLGATFVATRPPRMDPYLARLPLHQYVAEPQTAGQVAGTSDTSREALQQDTWWHLRRNAWPSPRTTG